MLRSYKLGVLGLNVLAGGLFLSFTRSFRRFEEFIVIEQKITLSQLKSRLLPLRSPYAPLIHMHGSSIHLAQVPSYRHTSWNSKLEFESGRSGVNIKKCCTYLESQLKRSPFPSARFPQPCFPQHFPSTLFPINLVSRPVLPSTVIPSTVLTSTMLHSTLFPSTVIPQPCFRQPCFPQP
jgi:hypothetical protein